jgi:hypothetical protein
MARGSDAPFAGMTETEIAEALELRAHRPPRLWGKGAAVLLDAY